MSAYHAAHVLPERLDDSEGDSDARIPPRGRSTQASCALFLVVFACILVYFAQGWKGLIAMPDWKALQQKQQVAPQRQGGTLEVGLTCPSQCGSFIACEPQFGSRNNLLQLPAIAGLGLFPFPDVLQSVLSQFRLFNKQITVFIPEFQCPNSTCMIPNAFVNDDFCDCPGTCADEFFHECETCAATSIGFSGQGVGCPAVCGSLSNGRLAAFSCLGTGSNLNNAFVCPGSTDCQIDPLFVNDNRCDCPDCADEDNWNCSTCACPTICGLSLYECDGSGVFSCPPSPDTNQTCNIPESLANDAVCNCPGTCADEASFLTCDACTCPNSCGQVFILPCVIELVYSSLLELSQPFFCNDGCPIPKFKFFDNYCDCSECEDEPHWDCSRCECPSNCTGNEVENRTPCLGVYFLCPGSELTGFPCFILPQYVNDNYCDCADCADEDAWTCDTCDYGCGPCGQGRPCDLSAGRCEGTDCIILRVLLNDNICDCPNCTDEDNWNCDTCDSGCPETCGGDPAGLFELFDLRYRRRCTGLVDLLPGGAETPVFCPGFRPDASLPFFALLPLQPLCAISPIQVGNGVCDCPFTCADEENCSVEIPPENCSQPVPCSSSRRLEEDANYSASKAGCLSTNNFN